VDRKEKKNNEEILTTANYKKITIKIRTR